MGRVFLVMKTTGNKENMEGFIQLQDVLDQEKETDIDRKMYSGCDCEFCGRDEGGPFVAFDSLLVRCSVNDGSYIPVEIVYLVDIINSLQERLDEINRRQRTLSLPYFRGKRHRISDDTRNNNNNDNEAKNKNKSSLFRPRSTGNSPALSKLRRERSQFSISRSNSSPSLEKLPNSILLKCCEKHSSIDEEVFEGVLGRNYENEEKLKQKFKEQIIWVKENMQEFVSMEKLKTTIEVSALLTMLIENKLPAVVQLKVNCNKTITISYHFLDKFRQEFMMLKVNENYCMFMAPF